MVSLKNTSSRGQSMVIIALMLVALIAILALTIDGGFTFVQRRRAQNAADAGALAGARAMCTTGSGDPMMAAKEFASRNGIINVDENVVVSPYVSDSVKGVVVNVSIPYNTFFASIIGISDTKISAEAEAACYPPCSGGGVLPIAWSCTPPVGSDFDPDSNYCSIKYADAGTECSFPGDFMYIIADSQDFTDSIICQDPDLVPEPQSGLVDCDLDDDGENEVILLSGADRSWLNLNGDAATTAELQDWLENGFHEFDLQEHMWFNGSTGVATKGYIDIRAYLQNKTVFIPVFDTYCPNRPGSDNSSCSWHSEDVIKDTQAGTKDYFHIYAFSLFHITCVTATGKNCPVNQALKLPPQIKTAEGCFVQGIVEDGSGEPGQCNVDVGAYILKLIR